MFVFQHPHLFSFCGHSWPQSKLSVSCANLLKCWPSPPTLLSSYLPATGGSSSDERKRPYVVLKRSLPKWNAPSLVHAFVWTWPTFFSNRVCVCLSDCSLETCFPAPWVIGNGGNKRMLGWTPPLCPTDCSKGKQAWFFFFFLLSLSDVFFSFMKPPPKCFGLVILLVMLFLFKSWNSYISLNPRSSK